MISEIAMRKKKNLTDEMVKIYTSNFMEKADINRDGKITKEEFYNYYKSK